MKSFDLHIHSIYSSDGEMPVADIVDKCAEAGLTCFSMTDHNSVKANAEAHNLAKEKNIDFIHGIEIDCNYKGTDLHVLGYGIDWTSDDFRQLEEDVFTKTMNAFSSMIDNIVELGFKVDADAVLAAANGKLPTGELIAEVMLVNEKYHTPLLAPYMPGGQRGDMPYINFYLDYFAQGKPAFVPIVFMDYLETIDLIRKNGGIPVVAHPGLNLKGKEKIVLELLNNGADGLEVFNNYHSAEQMDYFASVIKERKCLMTCGSDFHGKTKPLIQVGQFRFDERYEKDLEESVKKLQASVR